MSHIVKSTHRHGVEELVISGTVPQGLVIQTVVPHVHRSPHTFIKQFYRFGFLPKEQVIRIQPDGMKKKAITVWSPIEAHIHNSSQIWFPSQKNTTRGGG